jgi:hypothetical protein
MTKDRLSMRKFKEVLRLKYGHHLTNRKIAKSCAMSLLVSILIWLNRPGLSGRYPMTSMTVNSSSAFM